MCMCVLKMYISNTMWRCTPVPITSLPFKLCITKQVSKMFADKLNTLSQATLLCDALCKITP